MYTVKFTKDRNQPQVTEIDIAGERFVKGVERRVSDEVAKAIEEHPQVVAGDFGFCIEKIVKPRKKRATRRR